MNSSYNQSGGQQYSNPSKSSKPYNNKRKPMGILKEMQLSLNSSQRKDVGE